MYIEIENTEIIDRDISSRKTGQVFYTRTQKALLFKDGSKHPFHFNFRLAFEDSAQARNAVGPISPGFYNLSDEAFVVDRFGEISLSITGAKSLVPREQAAKLSFGKTGTAG